VLRRALRGPHAASLSISASTALSIAVSFQRIGAEEQERHLRTRIIFAGVIALDARGRSAAS